MRLTRDEIYLIAGVVLALVTGALVKHYRAAQRVQHAVSAPARAVGGQR